MTHAHDVSIRHDIPGRLRLRIPTLSGDRDASLTAAMERARGVLFVRVNSKCASMVLRYDPDTTNRGEILNLARGMFGAPEKRARPGRGTANEDGRIDDRSAITACTTNNACVSHEGNHLPAGTALRRFTALTALVGAVFVRTTFVGAAVSQALLSPLGLVTLACGLPLTRRGLRSLRRGRPSIDTFLAGGILASVVGGQALTALEILWIHSGADLLSSWITEKSRRHISDILELTSHHTFVFVDGVEIERDVAALSTGDVVVLHTGEKVCVDGEVVHGEALLNEAPITGRPDCVHKTPGDAVFAGTFVQEGVIRVRATMVGDATYLSRVMHKVQDSMETRAPIEGVADRLAGRMMVMGFWATLGTLLVTGSLWRAYTVLLVMACPCATVLAASTAVSAAMNAAARNHILIKGGRYLEAIGNTKTVFFDKTGTLATALPGLALTAPANGMDRKELLRLAVSAETHNHHPLAQAVIVEAAKCGAFPIPHSECDYHMGMGMRARIKDDEILVGNAKLAKHYGIDPANLNGLSAEATACRELGLTMLYVYRNQQLQGILGFETRERPRAEQTLQELRKHGVERVVLITGDEEPTARAMAIRLGMDAYHASVMPEDKAAIVLRDARRYGPVLMVGDGINDALALAEANVGVAFGAGGSEVAVEAADIALVRDDLDDLVAVYALSRKTTRVAYQNFWIAAGSNVFGVALGAAGLLSPVMAGLLHIAHSLGVLANSSRLLRLPTPSDKPSTGATHGLQHTCQVAALSDHQASRAGQDPHQIRPIDRQ